MTGSSHEGLTGHGLNDVCILVDEFNDGFEASEAALSACDDAANTLRVLASGSEAALHPGHGDADSLDDGDNQRTKGKSTEVVTEGEVDSSTDTVLGHLGGAGVGPVPEDTAECNDQEPNSIQETVSPQELEDGEGEAPRSPVLELTSLDTDGGAVVGTVGVQGRDVVEGDDVRSCIDVGGDEQEVDGKSQHEDREDGRNSDHGLD